MKNIHILSRLVNTPLAISSDKLHIINSNVVLKLIAGEEVDNSMATPAVAEPEAKNELAIIHIHGTLVGKGTGAGASGMRSYASIKRNLDWAIAEGHTNILLDIASCGGEVSGLFPLTDYINSLKGVNIYGFTDSEATSAAYAILAACKKVYVTDLAQVASIGIIASLIDLTAQDKEKGVKYEIIRSKDSKALYNPHETISKEVLASFTEHVMEADAKFDASMVKYRKKLTVEGIKELDGKCVSGSAAVSLGLADYLVSGIDEVISKLSKGNTLKSEEEGGNFAEDESEEQELLTPPIYSKQEDLLMTPEQIAALVGQNATLQAQVAELQGGQVLAEATAVQKERMRTLKAIDSGRAFGMSADTVRNAIAKGYEANMMADFFKEIASNRDEATAIRTGAADVSGAMPDTIDVLKAKLAAAEQEAKGISAADLELVAGLKALEGQAAEPNFSFMN